MSDHDVIVVGAGPTGLMLAGELALARVDVGIVERREGAALAGSRAGGLHARTIEVFDQRGIADRFLAEGQTAQVCALAGSIILDIGDFPTRHPYGLALWQNHIERILGGWVIDDLRVPIYRGRTVTGFDQDESGVGVRLSERFPLRARYLVGCDGGRSVIRRAAGIGFPGWEPTISHIIAEAELAEEPPWGIRYDDTGHHGISRLDDTGRVRILVTEPDLGGGGEATLGDLSANLVRVFGTDYGLHSPVWISRFTDAARQAAAYRADRVLLAGDAAHIHYPAGGQGLNIGIQDAVNLGWKLAQVVRGTSADDLLDTYQTERHPVAAWVLRHTLGQVALQRRDARTRALVETLADVMSLDQPRRQYAGALSGLGLRYDFGDGHALLGRRVPDLDLTTTSGPARLSTLLHGARPVLLNFGTPGSLDVAPWSDRVRLVEARFDGTWEVPVIGRIEPPEAVLVRPDGYVAWVGDRERAGLADALTTWFGQPRAV